MCSSGVGADTVERSECGVAEAYRSGSWHNLLFRTRPITARTAVPLSAVEGESKNVSRRVPLATNPLCRKANNASAPLKGKEGDDSKYPARSGERSEKSLPKSTLYNGGIGQQR